MKLNLKLTPVSAALLVILCIVGIWGLTYPIASSLPQNAFQEPLNSSYNVLNVLFTALAFGGVIITLIFQAQEARNARSESVERAILEMFQILTSDHFQATKNAAFRVLIAAIRNRDYGEYVASKLFAVGQLPWPGSDAVKQALCELDGAKQAADAPTFEHLERHDRLKLDDMMNFFSMLAQRESSASIVHHVDFAYDWWRPALMLIAQLQKEQEPAAARHHRVAGPGLRARAHRGRCRGVGVSAHASAAAGALHDGRPLRNTPGRSHPLNAAAASPPVSAGKPHLFASRTN